MAHNKAFHRTSHKVRRPVNADVGCRKMKSIFKTLPIALLAGGCIHIMPTPDSTIIDLHYPASYYQSEYAAPADSYWHNGVTYISHDSMEDIVSHYIELLYSQGWGRIADTPISEHYDAPYWSGFFANNDRIVKIFVIGGVRLGQTKEIKIFSLTGDVRNYLPPNYTTPNVSSGIDYIKPEATNEDPSVVMGRLKKLEYEAIEKQSGRK